MNLLTLMNNVLTRLREDTVTESTYNQTPFYKMIHACVNDAKDAVENAWDWTALRDVDLLQVLPDEYIVPIGATVDQTYSVRNIIVQDTGARVERRSNAQMLQLYQYNLVTPPPSGEPVYWNYYTTDPVKGKQILIYPPSSRTLNLWVSRTKHQLPLDTWDDVLFVPALPVYTLALALASRERGEIGGTPVSELFVIADRHLSDAIARDVATVPTEVHWNVI